jgi:alkylated DNA repair protein alkB family protein 4
MKMNVSPCACKGIRSCNLCEPKKDEFSIDTTSNTIFIYCDACRQAIRMDIYELNSQCPHHNEIGNAQIAFPLDGIYLAPDFLTETEENDLLNSIDNDIWISSQSGRLKQDFGIKINFKKQTIKTKYFTGMPMYSKFLLERLQTHRLLNDFQSVELCHLDYRPERGSHIDPHIDDTWIWGERLITINLLSNTILCLIPNEKTTNQIIYIPLPRRWMIVLYGDARYEYKHAIQRQHIQERRLAVTFRELTGKNEKFYEENKELYEKIIRISKRFTGITVGRFEQIVNEINSNIPEAMEMDISTKQDEEFKELFQSTYQTNISSFEIINSSTYLITSDKQYLMKIFPNSLISIEQLKSILSSCQLNETILNTSSHLVIILHFLSPKQIGYFLAQWRLSTLKILPSSSGKNPFDNEWFNQQYAIIIHKKKNSYPFLLSNLFTCQQQISSLSENQLEFGLLWSNTEQSYYLIDLALTCLMNIDQMKEIINAYEEMIQLTDDEMNFLDTFIRLQLVLMISHNDIDDEKQLDLLEQLSSNIFFVRNIVR